MVDISQTIAPKSDQLNADDLIGGPRTIQITRVTASPDSPEQPVSIFFEGDNGKPFKPCKSMRRVLVQVWGNDGATYSGRAMTLYRDPDVLFGGIKVGGIRISHMSSIDREVTMALTASKSSRKPYTVRPLRDAPSSTQGRAASNGQAAGSAKAAIPVADHVEAAKDALIKAAPHGAGEVEAKWSGAKMVALKERLRAPEHAELLMDLTEVYTSAKSAASTSELEGAF